MQIDNEMTSDLRETTVTVGTISLNVLLCGDPARPPMLFLHGFPEFSGMWAEILPHFADRYFCIAPDQRGYNLSSRPAGVDNYKTSKMSGDAVALVQKLAPGKKIVLVGHDWGAAVAYAVAMWKPDLLDALVIINGLHPATFQQALLDDPEQVAASQYFHTLRADGAEDRFSANNFSALFDQFGKFSDTGWMTARHRRDYVNAWSQPGALTAMLDWYRASPIHVPLPDEDTSGHSNPFADPEKTRVKPRHLLIWGEADRAMRPSCHADLATYCDDLTKVLIPDGDHWLVHTHRERIAQEIDAFLAGR